MERKKKKKQQLTVKTKGQIFSAFQPWISSDLRDKTKVWFNLLKIDEIILGCTHYPIYQELIKQELGYPVNLINTGITVSEKLEEFLKSNNSLNEQEHNEELIFLTKPENEFYNIAKNLLDFNIKIREIT